MRKNNNNYGPTHYNSLISKRILSHGKLTKSNLLIEDPPSNPILRHQPKHPQQLLHYGNDLAPCPVEVVGIPVSVAIRHPNDPHLVVLDRMGVLLVVQMTTRNEMTTIPM